MALILALPLLILIPVLSGLPLLYLWNPRRFALRSKIEIAALSFSWGFFLWTWLTWVAYQIQLHVFSLLLIYAGISALLYGLAFIRHKRTTHGDVLRSIDDSIDLSSETLSKSNWALIATVILMGVVFFFAGSYQDPSSDSVRHLAFITRIDSQQVLSKDVFFLSENLPYTTLSTNNAFSAIYPIHAAISSLLSVEPSQLWFHAPGVMVPFLLIVYFVFATAVFRSRLTGFLTLILLIVYWGIEGHGLRGSGYPNAIGLIVYLGLFAETFWLIQNERWNIYRWICLGAMGSCLLVIHTQWWLFFLLTLGVLFIQMLLQRSLLKLSRVLLCGMAVAVASIPFLISKLEFYLNVQGLQVMSTDRYLNRLYMIGDHFAVNPLSFGIFEWAFTIAGLFFVIQALRSRENKGGISSQFAALMILLIIFIQLNPILVPIIAQFGTATLVFRLGSLLNLWGIFLLASLLTLHKSQLIDVWQSSSSLIRRAAVLLIVAGALFVFLVRPLQSALLDLRNHPIGQRLISILTDDLGLSESLLRSLFPLLAAGLLIVSVGLSLILIRLLSPIWQRHREALVHKNLWIKRDAIAFSLVFVSVVMLIAPGSELSPIRIARFDNTVATLYGPTLSQVNSSNQLQQMLDLFPKRSLIMTDARKFVAGFADIKLVGDVQGFPPAGRELNQSIQPIFEQETSDRKALELLIKYAPDYLVLSPLYSHLAWMKYDDYSEVLTKIFEERIPELDYYNKLFVVYEVDVIAAQAYLEAGFQRVPAPVPAASPVPCEINMIGFTYTLDLNPRGRTPNGDELSDGQWSSTDESLHWALNRETWFYIELRLEDEHFIDRIEVKNRHLSSSYRLNELGLYMSHDGLDFLLVDNLVFTEPHGGGIHEWAFSDLQRNARAIRLAVRSSGPTTLGEIEIFGCPAAAD